MRGQGYICKLILKLGRTGLIPTLMRLQFLWNEASISKNTRDEGPSSYGKLNLGWKLLLLGNCFPEACEIFWWY